jgi:hypothetical protein
VYAGSLLKYLTVTGSNWLLFKQFTDYRNVSRDALGPAVASNLSITHPSFVFKQKSYRTIEEHTRVYPKVSGLSR